MIFQKFPGIMHNFIKALFRQRAIKAAINFPKFLSGMAPAFKKKICKGTCMKLPSRRDHHFQKKSVILRTEKIKKTWSSSPSGIGRLGPPGGQWVSESALQNGDDLFEGSYVPPFDGSEILHQLIWWIFHYLQGFIRPRWCRISSINSTFSMTFKNLVQPYQEQNWPIPVDFSQQNVWTSIVGMLFQGLICCGKMMSFEKTVYKKYIYICCIYKRLTLWKTHIIPARIYPLELRTYNLYIYPNSLRVNNSSDKPWNGLPRK